MIKPNSILQGKAGRYRVGRELGRGGVGVVFDGVRIDDGGTPVAIKTLHGNRIEIDETARFRFQIEIDASLGMDHPHVVRSIDNGVHGKDDDESEFLVMERLTGGTVAERIKKNNYDDETALRWCRELIEGLRYIHSRKHIHRDLKPNNLLLDESGVLKISDLGIVKWGEAGAVTVAHDQLGSLLYISPHQRSSPGQETEADDFYGACCCMYEILSRERIQVVPPHLSELASDSFSRYLCDLVMTGMTGHSERPRTFALIETALQHDVAPTTPEAIVLDSIVVPESARSLSGLIRHDLGAAAPMWYEGSDRVYEFPAMPQGRFLTDDVLITLAAPHELTRIEIGADGLQIQRLALKGVGGAEMVTAAHYLVLLTDQQLVTYVDRDHALAEATSVPLPIEQVGRAAGHPTLPLVVLTPPKRDRLIAFDVETRTSTDYTEHLEGNRIGDLFITRDGRIGAASSGRVVLIDVEEKRAEAIAVPAMDKYSLAGDGDRLYLSGRRSLECLERGSRVWRLASLPLLGSLKLDPTGRFLGARALGSEWEPMLFDLSGRAYVYLQTPWPDESSIDRCTSIAWSPSGRRFASMDEDGFATIFTTAVKPGRSAGS